jgi:6,7-dimethyl-8-ribityllumazine synthase
MASERDEAPPRERARSGVRVGCVVSSFHLELTEAMLASARRELVASGVAPSDILVVRVPGAFELPLLARRLAIRDDVDCVLALGLVLKGETSHDEHIARTAAAGIGQVGLETDKPVLFGVLTCATLAQARARALPPEEGGTHDKGREVARAALAALRALEEARSVGLAARPMGFFAGDTGASA